MKQPLEVFRRHTLNYSQETQGSQESTEKGKAGWRISQPCDSRLHAGVLSIREYINSSRNSSGKADEICRKTKHGVSAIILGYASRVKKTSLNPLQTIAGS